MYPSSTSLWSGSYINTSYILYKVKSDTYVGPTEFIKGGVITKKLANTVVPASD
jgi:hypothetical protein